MNPLFTINCLWIGNKLGPTEQLCLLSMLKQGHQVRLFTYEAVLNVPSGIEIISGNSILPREKILYDKKRNSPALGSDVFRLKLQEHNLGIWLDLDILLLKPLFSQTADLFGRQHGDTFNNAVLYLNSDSPILKSLIDFVSNPYPVPPFFSRTSQFMLKTRKTLRLPKHVSYMNWGVFGPKALTHFIRVHNSTQFAQPEDVFYPVNYKDAHGPFTANWNTEKHITPNTKALHLWNEMLKKPSSIRPDASRNNFIVEKNSFVEKYAREELEFRFK